MKSCLVFSQCSYYWNDHYEAQQHSICKNYFCRSCSVRFYHFIQFNCDVTLRLHFHACIVSVYCVHTSLLPLWNTLLFQFAYSICNLVLSDEICLMYSSLLFGFWFLKAWLVLILFHFLYVPPYALFRESICVIITVSQSEGSTVFCKLELHGHRQEKCLKFGLILG